MGMGPQQLDVRLDGRLLKRFTVAGQPRAGPPPVRRRRRAGIAGDPDGKSLQGAARRVGIRVPASRDRVVCHLVGSRCGTGLRSRSSAAESDE